MLNLVAKHLNPTEIGSLRESFMAMVRPQDNVSFARVRSPCDGPHGMHGTAKGAGRATVQTEPHHCTCALARYVGPDLCLADTSACLVMITSVAAAQGLILAMLYTVAERELQCSGT